MESKTILKLQSIYGNCSDKLLKWKNSCIITPKTTVIHPNMKCFLTLIFTLLLPLKKNQIWIKNNIMFACQSLSFDFCYNSLAWAKLINLLGYTVYTLYNVQCTHCTMYNVHTVQTNCWKPVHPYCVHTVQINCSPTWKHLILLGWTWVPADLGEDSWPPVLQRGGRGP